MDMNQEINAYGIPILHYDRTVYEYDKRVKTTCNIGEITPIYTNLLVEPGDTFQISLTDFTRLTTSRVPPMDDILRGIYAFSCSWLALWDHATNFWGENTDANFNLDPEYTVPKFLIDADAVINNRSILNRLGMPMLTADEGGTRLDIPFERLTYNMYLHIYNYFFRNQNYIPAYEINKGDEDITYSTFTGPKNLLKASRFHDYFMGIPEPQFGDPATINFTQDTPVIGNGIGLGLTDGTNDGSLRNYNSGGGNFWLTSAVSEFGNAVGTNTFVPNDTLGDSVLGVTTDPEKSGLIAKTSQLIGETIEAFRVNAIDQQIKERLAWYGRLYQNITNSFWGVEAGSENLRLPILLGANRAGLNMDTVLQTSETTAQSPQGDPAGYSATLHQNGVLFTKSFTEHSIIMILYVARANHSYAQGINCQHQKFRKYDFHWNQLNGLGAQDIKMSEIFVAGATTDNDKWACKPAWQEYRTELDEVTGQMSPTATGSLVDYTYTDYYADGAPVMSQAWIEEPTTYVDRTLAVTSEVADQLMIDCNFHIKKITEVPAYNLPGIDKI